MFLFSRVHKLIIKKQNELSEKLEKLTRHQQNIEQRSKRQEELLNQRKSHLDEVQSNLDSCKDYSATLHVKSQELANHLREVLVQSDADSDSIGSLTPVGQRSGGNNVSSRNLSLNDTLNRINEVARAKSFAARIKAKSNALKRGAAEDAGLDDEKLEEDVNELLSINLSDQHPPELHNLFTELKETSKEHSTVKANMNELKREVENKKKSFHEATIENEILEKQNEKEKEVNASKILAHAIERKQLEVCGCALLHIFVS